MVTKEKLENHAVPACFKSDAPASQSYEVYWKEYSNLYHLAKKLMAERDLALANLECAKQEMMAAFGYRDQAIKEREAYQKAAIAFLGDVHILFERL